MQWWGPQIDVLQESGVHSAIGFSYCLIRFLTADFEKSNCLLLSFEGIHSHRNISSDTGVGCRILSKGLKRARDNLAQVCNILILHNHQVQLFGFIESLIHMQHPLLSLLGRKSWLSSINNSIINQLIMKKARCRIEFLG